MLLSLYHYIQGDTDAGRRLRAVLSLRDGDGIFHFCVTLNRLLLLGSELVRDHDLEGNDHITAFLLTDSGLIKAQAGVRVLFVVRGARFEDDLFLTHRSVDSDRPSENRLGYRDLPLAVKVVAVAAEPIVLAHGDLDNEVAALPVERLVAAVLQPQQRTVVDELRDPDADVDFLLQDSIAFTRKAIVGHSALGAAPDALVGEGLRDAGAGLEVIQRHFEADVGTLLLRVSDGAVRGGVFGGGDRGRLIFGKTFLAVTRLFVELHGLEEAIVLL